MLRLYPEIVTETTEDPSNPFLTSVILDGVVVAKGGFTNKKSSRQVAARQALAIMCPLLTIDDERFELGAGAAEPQQGQSCSLGIAQARLLCLLSAHLAALGKLGTPRVRPSHWAPRHRFGGLKRAAC